MIDVTEFVNRLKVRFEERLQKKTGWGKNEVMVVLHETIAEVALEYAVALLSKGGG